MKLTERLLEEYPDRQKPLAIQTSSEESSLLRGREKRPSTSEPDENEIEPKRRFVNFS